MVLGQHTLFSVGVFLDKVRLGPGGPGHAACVLAQGGQAVGLGPLEELLLPRRHVLTGPGLQTRGLQGAAK